MSRPPGSSRIIGRMGRMKRLIVGMFLVMLAGKCLAGGMDYVPLRLSNVSTSTTPTEAATPAKSGMFEGIIVNVGTNGIDCDLDILITNEYAGVSRVIYSADDITTNVDILIRTTARTTGGAPASTNWLVRFPLVGERFVARGSDSDVTNRTVDIYIKFWNSD